MPAPEPPPPAPTPPSSPLPPPRPPLAAARTADFLATVPLLGGLGTTDLARFGELTRERHYPKGSVIVSQGDPGDSLFVVRRGRVKVVLIGEDGREVILGILEPAAYFGELSLIDGQPRSAHVIAMDNATMLMLRRDDFRRRVQESPALAWALMAELSRRLRRADDQIGSLVLLDVTGRIARLLLDAADETPGPAVDKRLTHQTIAHLIGASRETVSRAMRELQQRGLVTVEQRRIRIADRAALDGLARGRTPAGL